MRRLFGIGTDSHKDKEAFGAQLRSSDYSLALHSKGENWGITNNGSIGVAPNEVMAERRQLLEQCEENPDRFFRETLPEKWFKSLFSVCEHFDIPVTQTVLLDNTTTGINDVLNSFPFNEGDSILITSLAYDGVLNASHAIAEKRKLNVATFPIRFPIASRAALIQQFDDMLKHSGRVRLAVVEAIASGSAAHLPVKDLIEVAKKHNVAVLIDGAHACGQLADEEVHEMCKAGDFFVTSLHKWMFAPRPSGLLHCTSKEYIKDLRPSVAANGSNSKELHMRYAMLGTKDYTPLLVLHQAIAFRKRMNGLVEGGIAAYNKKIIDDATKRLCERFGTQQLRFCQDDKDDAYFQAPFMRNIRLPDSFQDWFLNKALLDLHDTKKDPNDLMAPIDDGHVAVRIQLLIIALYEIHHVTSMFHEIDGVVYLRICSQIYNSPSDYERLGDALQAIEKQIVHIEKARDFFESFAGKVKKVFHWKA